MIKFEHCAPRRQGEAVLAGYIVHGPMDNDQARALSFLNAAALPDLHQWTAVLEVEVDRQRKRQNRLDRAVRRVQHYLVASNDSAMHHRFVNYVEAITSK